MQQVSCPSCGNPVTFVSRVTGYAVCDACQSMLVRQDLDIQLVGKSAMLQEDGTPLMLSTTGEYRKIPFEIIGRIQVKYPAGFWNEWFLFYADGTHGWLGEAQGNYFASYQTQVPEPLPGVDDIRRGNSIVMNGNQFVVTQLQRAVVIGCEGELPFLMQAGYDAPLADLRTAGIVGATIDYSENPPLVFIGEYLDFDALGFKNVREIEGWNA